MIGAAAGATFVPKNAESKSAALETTKHQEYTAAEARALLNQEIDRLAAIDTNIPPEQIVAVLKQCSFLADKEIPITQVRQYREAAYDEPDRFNDNMTINIGTGEYLPTEKLNVIQLREFGMSLVFVRAFYEQNYHAIVIEESPENDTEAGRKKALELSMAEHYSVAVSDDSHWDRSTEWRTYVLAKATDNDILHYYQRLIEGIRNQVQKNIRDKTQTLFGLPHEAFHHFFVTMLGEEGYAGPAVSELLYTAIDQTMQRFQKDQYPNFDSFIINCPRYSLGVPSYLRRDGINTKKKCQKFCNGLANVTDLTTLWKLSGDEDEESAYVLKIRNSFSLFLNEYLARIYNGALGNTEARYASETTRALQAAGFQDAKSFADDFIEIAHTPTSTELEVLKKMSWQGRPLI